MGVELPPPTTVTYCAHEGRQITCGLSELSHLLFYVGAPAHHRENAAFLCTVGTRDVVRALRARFAPPALTHIQLFKYL